MQSIQFICIRPFCSGPTRDYIQIEAYVGVCKTMNLVKQS